ncbi:MAG: M23 family metallopeptidase [Actinobacteria bacterium]|nr:M23 family metallopeptidase [Actinomycetota bacterium]
MDATTSISSRGRHLAPASIAWHRLFVALAVVCAAVIAASADYTVQPGDTLGVIASNLDVSVGDLAAANAISNPDLIRPGQVLVVPGAVGGGTHVVLPGETLAGIADQHGLDAATLASINGITNPSLIYIGTALRLSGPETPTVTAAAQSSAAVHVVAPGDSLAAVAASYGTSVSALVDANGIANPNLIRVGQQLTVPGAGGSWICPVADASFFNDWGFPRTSGRFHVGNDLYAPHGAPVRAPVGGWLDVLTGPVGGLQFRLYGDDGNTYIGTHLDTAIESGPVAAGQQVGSVGTSGNAAGADPHLHFELHPGDGEAVNPYPTLQAAGC